MNVTILILNFIDALTTKWEMRMKRITILILNLIDDLTELCFLDFEKDRPAQIYYLFIGGA